MFPMVTIEETLVMSFPFGAISLPTLADFKAEMHSSFPILPVDVVCIMLLFWISPVPSRWSAKPSNHKAYSDKSRNVAN